MSVSNDLLPLVIKYVNQFCEKPDESLKFFANSTGINEIFNMVYTSMVNSYEIEPLESLDAEMKRKLFTQAQTLAPQATQQRHHAICKTIWLINTILEK